MRPRYPIRFPGEAADSGENTPERESGMAGLLGDDSGRIILDGGYCARQALTCLLGAVGAKVQA